MRKHGTIGECQFKLKGWSIYTLSYEYILIGPYNTKTVFVDNYKQLKEKIADFMSDCYSDNTVS